MKKILYCFTLNTFITTALLHRLAYRRDSYAVFMCDKLMFESRGVAEAVKKLKDNGIIDDLILDVLLIRYDLHITMEEYSSYIEQVYDNVFFKAGYSVDDFDEIYCINDNWGYYPNIYLNIKKIPYFWMNVSKDIIYGSYKEWNTDIGVKKLESNEFLNLVNFYNALTPFAPYAIPVILSGSNKKTLDKFKGKRYITWDKEYALSSLSSVDIDKIVSCFDVKEPQMYSEYIILDSWGSLSYGVVDSLGYKSYGDSIKLAIGDNFLNLFELHSEYIKVLSDYYTSNESKIMIKSHPAEYINNDLVTSLLGEQYLTAGNINFEFIQSYYNNHNVVFKSAIGTDSTSLEVLNDNVFLNKKILGASFNEVWFFYNSIYITIKCLKSNNMKLNASSSIAMQVNLISKYRNLSVNCEEINFYNWNDFEENDVLLLNALKLEKEHINISDVIRHVGQSTNVIFFNINYTKLFFEEEIQNKLLYLDVQKKFHNNGYNGFAKPEMIWFYCGTFDFYKKILNFSLSEDMPRQNFLLNAEMKVPDKIVLNSMFNIPAQLAKNNHEHKDMQEWLVNENDIHKYINKVKLLTKGTLLVIAINEGISKIFEKNILDILRQMGFNNIPSLSGYSYVGIMCDRKINYDKKSSIVGQPVVCNGNVDDLKIEVISVAGKINTKAVIKINDYDYAINGRGLNLFILDLNDRKILESVSIFAEHNEIKFNRKRCQ